MCLVTQAQIGVALHGAVQGDLIDDDARLLASHQPWLRDLLVTDTTESLQDDRPAALIDANDLYRPSTICTCTSSRVSADPRRRRRSARRGARSDPGQAKLLGRPGAITRAGRNRRSYRPVRGAARLRSRRRAAVHRCARRRSARRRGLRRADHKPHLTVVDFIGNHRSFLQSRKRWSTSPATTCPRWYPLAKLAASQLDLPDGCSVDVETDAIDMLARLAKRSNEDAVLYEYLTFRDAHGRGPTAAELHTLGANFKAIRQNHAGWFELVASQGDLTDDEARLLASHHSWLRDLLFTDITPAVL